MAINKSDEIVGEIRKIIRAVDLHSKALSKDYGLTGPQLMILTEIGKSGQLSVTGIARQVSLSQTTVTSILKRLEQRDLVRRERCEKDKRKILLTISEAGWAILSTQPSLLQLNFVEKFNHLKDWEQSLLISSLQRIASMMGAGETELIPLLTSESLPVEPVRNENNRSDELENDRS